MARSKSKLVPPSGSATSTAIIEPPNPNPNQDQEAEEEEEEESNGSLLHLVTSAITLSLRFLSSSDLLLPPAQSLSLSSVLRSSALSLSSLLSLLPNNSALILPSPIPRSNSTSTSTSTSSSSFCWYRRFLSSPLSSSLFPSHFHLSKPSFDLLLRHLSPSLLSLSSSSSPLPPDLKLASALFRLAHAAPFPALARRFGLPSPSLAARAFYEVIRALPLNLPLSSPPRTHPLPNCHAALLHSRLPIATPVVFSSLIAQFLVDSQSLFLDVSAGWHGSMHPAHILTHSKLSTTQSDLLEAGSYIVGDSSCPLLPWLITPYKNADAEAWTTSKKQQVFNAVHERGMEVARRAVARLKGRWSLLRMEWKEECVEALPYVVVASCLLHNFLIKCGDEMVVDGEDDLVASETMGFKEFEGKGDEEGEMVRDLIATHLTQVLLN